jgi:hypothetical protein
MIYTGKLNGHLPPYRGCNGQIYKVPQVQNTGTVEGPLYLLSVLRILPLCDCTMVVS